MLLAQQLDILVVPTIENGEELCIRVYFGFFVLHAKSYTTNSDRTGLSDEGGAISRMVQVQNGSKSRKTEEY